VTANDAGTDSTRLGVGFGPAFSADGTKVAFDALSSPSAPGVADVYVRDLAHGTTTRVSSDPSGTTGGNGHSRLPPAAVAGSSDGAFSPDGRRMVLVSSASNLGPTDHDRPTGSEDDVYLATLRGADLAIEGQAEPVEPGSPLTYRFDVANDGPDPAESTTVGVLLPEGVTFLDGETTGGNCEPTGEGSPAVVVCDLGDLAAGGTGVVTVRVRADAPAGSSLAAIGAVSSEATVDPVGNNDVVTAASTVGQR
jgi:uncharacterized repeat protein (TIGR01451 family)